MKKILRICVSASLLLFILSFSLTMGKEVQPVDDFLPEGDTVKVEIWVRDLEIPWSLIFLPDKRSLVSERPGRIRLIKNGLLQSRPYASIEVAHTAEGGLMGLAVHPEFPNQPYIYAMHTYEKRGTLYNRVVRLRDRGDSGEVDKTIIDNLPGGTNHDGGRIRFGPDGMLYITTGEAFKGELAQDLSSLGGKILRITPDGKIPPDNPFKDSPVYSYGHRNPQGIDWQPGTGKLFESEHGPSGEKLRFANDEINIITKGGNYGWPEIIGAGGKKSFLDPLIVWKKTTPPAGISFYKGGLLKHLKGDLFVATLKSRALIRISFDKKTEKVARIERWFAKDHDSGKYGRLRDVVEGPEGALYFTSSNRDGRGDPLCREMTRYTGFCRSKWLHYARFLE